jgi:hypothetical protein
MSLLTLLSSSVKLCVGESLFVMVIERVVPAAPVMAFGWNAKSLIEMVWVLAAPPVLPELPPVVPVVPVVPVLTTELSVLPPPP